LKLKLDVALDGMKRSETPTLSSSAAAAHALAVALFLRLLLPLPLLPLPAPPAMPPLLLPPDAGLGLGQWTRWFRYRRLLLLDAVASLSKLPPEENVLLLLVPVAGAGVAPPRGKKDGVDPVAAGEDSVIAIPAAVGVGQHVMIGVGRKTDAPLVLPAPVLL
jgi:hypothetical protein